ncbi:MAG: polyprenyl synthetase family protein [Flavobacteriales bacterium]|nr:polyprenyl synthetase family protein [Flavobacteriales bacterium]
MRERDLVDAHLSAWIAALPSSTLYAPMAYLLGLPAKRVRPVLTVMSCELFGGAATNVLDEAVGIELFHNFTLMHDDIMDASPLRRGQPTVHAKWDVNTAILSGDAMLVKAYQIMGSDPLVLSTFNRYALEVCEGQQRDMEFEERTTVTLAEYKEMIRSKTAVLLGCALRIGACKAKASEADQERIGAFGEDLGLAFQLRDDLLDAFGDSTVTGKQQGGDLRNGKKTWLMIRALERSAEVGDERLLAELGKPVDRREVPLMLQVLRELGVQQEAEEEVNRLESSAFAALDAIAISDVRKEPLRALVRALQQRSR